MFVSSESSDSKMKVKHKNYSTFYFIFTYQTWTSCSSHLIKIFFQFCTMGEKRERNLQIIF